MSSAPRIADITTNDPVSVSPGLPVADAASRMKELACRHLPVVDGRQLVGIVSAKDLGRGGATVADVMTPEPWTIGPDERSDVAAAAMALRKVSCLPVVDGGTLVGILTTYDLLDAFVKYFRSQS